MALPSDRLPWAFGYKRFGNEELPGHLLEIARTRANSAVRAADFSAIYLGAETTIRWLDAAIDAGSAIEILAKHYLSTVSAVLLLDNSKLQDTDYLHAVGRSDLVPNEDKYRALNLRTRGPRECLDLIGLITNKKDRISGGSAKAALDARNAAIHLGLVDRAELQAALINFAQVIAELLTVCDIAPGDFWKPDVLKLVSDLQAEKPFYDDLNKKFEGARQTIDGKQIARATTKALAQTGKTEDQFDIQAIHWKKIPCPVCGSAATLSGTERLHTYQSAEEAFRTAVLSDPEELSCDVCELALDKRELKQVHLDHYWEVGERWATDKEIEYYYDNAYG